MSNQRERAEEKRKEKLAAIEQQVQEGSLTIRSMTPKERKEHPKPDKPRQQRRKP